MDDSLEYIAMCDCPEIQDIWEPAIGDWVSVREKVLWDGYNLCASKGDVTIVLGLDERGYSGNPIIGDVDDIAFYPECSWKGFDDTPKENLIWLPRQDQLQAMYLAMMPAGTYTKVFTLIEEFYGHFEKYGYPSYAYSMEQLWLAFAMKTLHNKTWSGTEWV